MKKFFIPIFILISLSIFAQFEGIGQQDPPGIKWKKIDTPHFEIIFPQELIKEGQRVANTLEHIYKPLSKTLQKEPKRITILLSNRGVIPNGYVKLNPRMSEWFSVPASVSEMGVIDWYNILAIHEGRHIVQFDKFNQGFNKIMGILFGSYGQMSFSFLSAPMWFWEGDAVGIETALSNGGRGREPGFDIDIRTILLSNIQYPYLKAVHGSFKDRYPSWDHLGYLLTTHVKRKYGPETWSQVINHASRHSYRLYAFSRALKKVTGKSVRAIYKEAMEELTILWKAQLKGVTLTTFKTINSAPRKVWTRYTFPRYETNKTIIVQKSGMDLPLTLVRLYEDGREEKIRQFFPFDYHFNSNSIKNGKMVWNEIIPDSRWGKRHFSDLYLLDLKRNKSRRLTKKARLFDPALSPDSSSIAAVEFTPERKCCLVILNSKSANEIKRLPNPDNDLISSPSWSTDGTRIIFSRQNRKGRALTIINTDTEETRDILPLNWENITYPVFFGDFVFYNSPYSGIDNIYAVDVNTGEQFQITSSQYGAFFPEISPSGEKLLYSNYTRNGYDVAEMPLIPSQWKRLKDVEVRSLKYYEPLIDQENGGSIVNEEDIPKKEYEVKNYHSKAHLLKIHSWGLVPSVPDIRFSVISNDKFNLLSLTGGPTYNTNEKAFGFEINGSYSGLFPIINFGFSHGGRSSTINVINNKDITYSWRETSAYLGFLIPLNLSRGIYNTSITFGSNIAFTEISGQKYTDPYDNGNGELLPVGYHFNFARYRFSSFRDLYPTGGQYFFLSFYHTPWKGDYNGSLFSARAGLYFPGLFKHHSLRIKGGFERQWPDNYHFENDIVFPRGYDYRYHDTIYKASVNYAMPLAYPDWAVGNTLYLKRFRTNLFYDIGIGKTNNLTTLYQSVGIEFMADFHLFHLSIPFQVGTRLVYRIKDKKFRTELLIFSFNF